MRGALRAFRRSPHDREIVRLAVPALGALAAEPLYILVDTAVVGHLGRPQLAALGIAAVLLSGVFAIFNFLTYATTAQVARASGAGRDDVAASLGAQAFWLSLALGSVLAGALAAFAAPLVSAMGGEGQTADYAVTYMRIAVLGFPFAFLALAGQGYLRGVSDLRSPLQIVVAGNVVNLLLNPLFVYGFDWGIAGSAIATVIGQTAMGAAFAWKVLTAAHGRLRPRAESMRRLMDIGRHIFVRTAALYLAFVVAGAVASRFGDASIGAHQVAFQLWVFIALVLDSVAIAGQVIVGRALGSGDAEGAYDASLRMIGMAVVVGACFAVAMLALVDLLPRIFTSDGAVLDQARDLWPIFALMQPLNGAVFALDGILIGAGDGRYLMWSMLVSGLASAAVALAALAWDWGIVGVWAALLVLILVRLSTLGARFAGRRWLVTGWA